MTHSLENLLLEIPLSPRGGSQIFNQVSFLSENGIVPEDYLEAFSKYNGGAGDIGEAYIDLWQPEELAEMNISYHVSEYAPGFTIFGSDGGDTAYAFACDTGFIYKFPFIGMTMDEPAVLLGKALEEFLMLLQLTGND